MDANSKLIFEEFFFRFSIYDFIHRHSNSSNRKKKNDWNSESEAWPNGGQREKSKNHNSYAIGDCDSNSENGVACTQRENEIFYYVCLGLLGCMFCTAQSTADRGALIDYYFIYCWPKVKLIQRFRCWSTPNLSSAHRPLTYRRTKDLFELQDSRQSRSDIDVTWSLHSIRTAWTNQRTDFERDRSDLSARLHMPNLHAIEWLLLLGLLQVGTRVNSENSRLTFGKQKCIYENCGYSLIFECAAQMNGLFLNNLCCVCWMREMNAQHRPHSNTSMSKCDLRDLSARARAIRRRPMNRPPVDEQKQKWQCDFCTRGTAATAIVLWGKRGDGSQHAPPAHSRELNSLTITENEREKWNRRSLNLFLNADAETALVCVCVCLLARCDLTQYHFLSQNKANIVWWFAKKKAKRFGKEV